MKLRDCRGYMAALALMASPCHAAHDIEYVAEHIPEVAMDNRYATLPVWSGSAEQPTGWQPTLQIAASDMKVGEITARGPMVALSLSHALNDRWQFGGFAFYDRLALGCGTDARPLQTLFAPDTPIDRPVDAVFTNLDGTATDRGVGLYFSRTSTTSWLGTHRWIAGVLWQRVQLSDYRFDYDIVAGPQMGWSGSIDFDATYQHVVPVAGLELPRDFDRWSFSLHGLLAYPIPRRAVEGHITGPGFDLSGDQAAAGHGAHFGDPSVTLGLNATYRPAHLTFDVGTLLTQALIEPVVHSGIDRNWVLSISWAY